jgi:Tfp pilus assembly pilus retraction ATPase PilT
MRDSDTFQAAISASETGHLVFTTLHSSDVSQVIDRVMDFFPVSQHQQIKMQLALNLRAVISQRLMVRASGDGLIPAVEILINNPSVTKLIREDKLNKLYNAMQGGAEDGMQTFNQSLVKLVNEKLVTEEEALSKSTHPEALKMNIKGIYLDDDRRILGA